jgi:hypothetical protein
MSALQIYFPRDISYSNVKYYIIKFFEWEYKHIFGSSFDVTKDTNKNLIELMNYMRRRFKIHDFQINKQDYTVTQMRKEKFEQPITEIIAKHHKGDIVLNQENTKDYIDIRNKTKKTSFDFM